MTDFIRFLILMISQFFNFLFSFGFDLFGYTVSYGSIILVFVVTGFFITMFWKGARQ